MKDSYRTIVKPTEEILFKDRGSKFYATAYPFQHPDHLNPIIEELKKRHFKAGHHCYAWKIGADENNFRVNDDGEPRNSAGAPIYGQLQSFDMSDILVVVSRIFGGTKLGVSGLINAYKESATQSLEQAEVRIRTVRENIVLSFEYPQMSQVMRLIEEDRLKIHNQELSHNCKITLGVPQSKVKFYLDHINKMHPIKAKKEKPEE
ncbi:MAG: YigZ family protein [Nonlabens sp.]